LNWALEGFQDWVSGGLRPPAEIIDATSRYRQENDHVGQFIDARCVKQASEKCPAKTLFDEYVNWSEEHGHTPMPINSFGKDLTRKGYGIKKGSQGNSRAGINLKPEFRAKSSAEVFPISERMKALSRQG
jgi:putative DNA primase/helicase